MLVDAEDMQLGEAKGFIEGRFAKPLAQAGWRNGDNVTIVPHLVPMQSEWTVSVPKAVAEVVEGNYDGVFIEGEHLTRALQQAAPNLPIAAYLFDPVGQGFARTYAKPGGTVTGVHRASREVYIKQIDLLRRIVPGMSRMAWIGFTPQLEMGGHAFDWAAKEAGIAVRRVLLDGLKDGKFPRLAQDFRALRRDGYLGAQFNGALELDIKAVTEQALLHRIALSYTGSPQDLGREGLLLQYRSLRIGLDAKLALAMAKILGGQHPRDIPFEGPTGFSLRINLKTAERLGLKVPNDVQVMADEILR
jgi:putative ABC transport system substrate-binding protein